jgi:hypothetical protein
LVKKDDKDKEENGQELDYKPYFIGGAVGGGIIGLI